MAFSKRNPEPQAQFSTIKSEPIKRAEAAVATAESGIGGEPFDCCPRCLVALSSLSRHLLLFSGAYGREFEGGCTRRLSARRT